MARWPVLFDPSNFGIHSLSAFARSLRDRAIHSFTVEQNTLKKNRWGLYLQHADWLHVGLNTFVENLKADIHDAGNVTNFLRLGDADKSSRPPRAKLTGTDRAVQSEIVCAGAGPLAGRLAAAAVVVVAALGDLLFVIALLAQNQLPNR